jgi:hypothetical protein
VRVGAEDGDLVAVALPVAVGVEAGRVGAVDEPLVVVEEAVVVAVGPPLRPDGGGGAGASGTAGSVPFRNSSPSSNPSLSESASQAIVLKVLVS